MIHPRGTPMLKLKDIMTTDLVTVTPETSLRDAIDLLAERHVSGAPVVSGNVLMGVISASDLLSFAASTPGAGAERRYGWDVDAIDSAIEREDVPGGTFFSDLWDDAETNARERMAMTEGPEWSMLEAHEVGEAMTRSVVTLPPDADVTTAASLMREKGIHRILVTDDHVLVGIVSSMDITNAVADHKLETRRYVFARGSLPQRRRP
jgi:CBS domain-containing protein